MGLFTLGEKQLSIRRPRHAGDLQRFGGSWQMDSTASRWSYFTPLYLAFTLLKRNLGKRMSVGMQVVKKTIRDYHGSLLNPFAMLRSNVSISLVEPHSAPLNERRWTIRSRRELQSDSNTLNYDSKWRFSATVHATAEIFIIERVGLFGDQLPNGMPLCNRCAQLRLHPILQKLSP